MSSRFPERIDPLKLASQGQMLEGRFDLSQLPRLADLLADESGEVRFRFSFGFDAERRPIVRTHVSAALWLTCQRCMEPVEYDLDSHNTLAPVTGLDEARNLPGDYESLLLDEPLVIVRDMVEEEILLGIPAFPKHDTGCRRNDEAGGAIGESHSANPFSVLDALKKRDKQH